MPATVPALSEVGVALCISLILLVPLAIAGVALINTGFVRSRSAAHAMLSTLCVVAIAAAVYFACGFAVEGYAGRPLHAIIVAGKPWSWLAAEKFFFGGLELDGSPASLAALLQLFGVGLAAAIPLGSAADRWRLGASAAAAVLLAGCIYPLFAHWAWGGGWLAQLGVNYSLGRGFLDCGGAGSIQAVGGLNALAMLWILGPRRGKYSGEGIPLAIPGHNTVLVLFGCLLALPGWVGLNSAGAILFAGAMPARVVLIAVNTMLSASASALTSLLITRIRFGKPDASLVANGWVGGLVSSCAGCAFLAPLAALLIGIVAGALVTFSIQWLELIAVDDTAGSFSVHGLCGLWSLLAAGLFAHVPGAASGQWIAQVVGIATLLGFVLPLSYGLNLLLDRVLPQRVPPEGERQGMDLHELGAGAYPEFVTYTEESMQR
jgi:Amt family ammonium transporter